MRRAASVGLAALLLIGVVVVIVATRHSGSSSGSSQQTLVRGVIGSEKLPFFNDPAVQAEFAKQGYRVQVDTAGSREIATTTDLSKYDFAFPAGEPQANKIKADHKIAHVYQPFFTPMAIATFQPIVDLLTTAGVMHQQSGIEVLDVNAFLALVSKNERWSDLPGNTAYPAGKSILITSTDVRSSNSAAMYLSLASYSGNSNNIVTTQHDADTVLPRVSPLFLRQGFQASSSEEPFQDYLTIGIGKTPMVMIYEAQYRGAQIAGNQLPANAVLVYPSPTVYSKHTLVPINSKGDTIGQLLTTDPTLQHLAVQYGFRVNDATYSHSFAAAHHVPDLPALTNVIDPPTFDILEYMINSIDSLYKTEAQTP
ncbi:MAG: hypothetical protein ACREN2_05465 [Candidatus Dormibacteria bacterium]